jgi:hypothetical protein
LTILSTVLFAHEEDINIAARGRATSIGTTRLHAQSRPEKSPGGGSHNLDDFRCFGSRHPFSELFEVTQANKLVITKAKHRGSLTYVSDGTTTLSVPLARRRQADTPDILELLKGPSRRVRIEAQRPANGTRYDELLNFLPCLPPQALQFRPS